MGRYSMKRVWARNLWQLMSRLLRKVLSQRGLPANHLVVTNPFSS